MKKIKYLLLAMFAIILPISVKAEEVWNYTPKIKLMEDRERSITISKSIHTKSYEIYKIIGEELELVKTSTSNNIYGLSGCGYEEICYYRVIAVHKDGRKSNLSNEVSIVGRIGTVAFGKTINRGDYADIYWSFCSGSYSEGDYNENECTPAAEDSKVRFEIRGILLKDSKGNEKDYNSILLGTTSKLTYRARLKNKWGYRFEIVPYIDHNGRRYYGSKGQMTMEDLWVYEESKPVNGVDVSYSGNDVKISWKRDYQHKVNIYLSEDKEEWTLMGSAKNSMLLEELEYDTPYYIRVVTDLNGTNTGEYEDPYVIRIKPSIGEVYADTKSSNSIDLSTEYKEGVSDFIVYRSTTKNGTYKKIGTQSIKKKYQDKNITIGKTYYYKLRVCDEFGSCGNYSDVISAKVKIGDVNNFVTKSSTSSTVKLAWNKTTETGYQIYRSTDNEKYSKVKTISSYKTLSYTDDDLKSGTEYFYKIRSYRKIGKKYYYGEFSEPVSIRTTNPSVKISNTDNSSLKLTMNVYNLENPIKYMIYRSLDDNSGFKLVGEVNYGEEFTDVKLTAGKVYYYKVKACNEEKCTGYSTVSSNVVVPATIQNLESLNIKNNSITIKWDSTSGSGYQIYKSDDNEEFERVKTTESYKETDHTDTKLESGTEYYYKVRSYKKVGKKYYYGKYSEVITVKTLGPNVEVSNTDDSSLKLTITPSELENANKYYIYRSLYSSKNYENVGEVNVGEEFKDQTLIPGKTYYYKVNACNEEGICSEYSTVVSKMVKPGKVTNISTNNITSSQAKLTWDSAQVTGYVIYKSLYEDDDFEKVKTINGSKYNYYLDKNVKDNKTYYYKVRAFVKVGSKTYYGAYSDVVKADTLLKTPTMTITNENYNSLKLTIDKVKGAQKYEIYRSEEKNGNYELLTSLENELEYIDYELEFAKTYYYKVKVCNSRVCSETSKVYSKKVVPNKTYVSLRTTSKKITISYEAVEGVDGYEIYRSAYKNGTYKMIEDTTELKYTHSFTGRRKYYYKVRSYKYVGEEKVYSNFSTIKYIKTYK